METSEKFKEIFEMLKSILVKYESSLLIKGDSQDHYYLDTKHIIEHNKSNLFFGSAQIKKNYVSYYLMPVYVYPELLDNISADLKKRMQGKSCFNFKKLDEKLVKELSELTQKGFEKYDENGLIQTGVLKVNKVFRKNAEDNEGSKTISNKTIQSEHGLYGLEKVRAICTRFPEVEDKVDSFGHTSFRVKDKPFVMLGEKEETLSLAIKTHPTTQEVLLQLEGFFKTPYIGQHGWTSLIIRPETNWKEIEGYIHEAYLRTAPKRLCKVVEGIVKS
jgi:predicted DNA-binding protein (MmcQ/YjbR family)